MALGRIEQRRALLPLGDADYSFENLSQAETAALEAAHGDGFGDAGAIGSMPMATPTEVHGGLTGHSFFVGAASEYDDQENLPEFWDWAGDRPPPDAEPFGEGVADCQGYPPGARSSMIQDFLRRKHGVLRESSVSVGGHAYASSLPLM